MAGIHEITARTSGPRPLRRSLLLLVLGDELVLLVRIGFPQEAGHLVVAGTDALEKLLDATGRVGDAEGSRDPVTNLIRVAEAAGADFLLELLDLLCGKVAWVALVVQGTQDVKSLVAEDAQPLAQLGGTHAQELGDLIAGLAGGDGQDGGEALVEASIVGGFASPVHLLALLRGQLN